MSNFPGGARGDEREPRLAADSLVWNMVNTGVMRPGASDR
jgi:hypothetical protein